MYTPTKRSNTSAAHFNNIPLADRVLAPKHYFLRGIVPHNVHEMIYENEHYYTAIGLRPNSEHILSFKNIWAKLEEKYKDQLLPLYYVVENGTVSSYVVVHFRK